MKKVLIPTKLDKVAAQLLAAKNYNVVQDADTPIADLIAANSDAEVLIVRSEKITPVEIDALPNLKLVVRAGAGFNTIDTKSINITIQMLCEHPEECLHLQE